MLDEKHVLKRAAAGLVPPEILRRPKQPYRAPDATCFLGPDAPEWVGEVTSERNLSSAGVFNPRGVERLWRKCRDSWTGGEPSNSDNMALVGVLSTGLLHEQLVRRAPDRVSGLELRTLVDRLQERPGRGGVVSTRGV